MYSFVCQITKDNHDNPNNRMISRRFRSTGGTPCCIADALRVCIDNADAPCKMHAVSAPGTRGQKGMQMNERTTIIPRSLIRLWKEWTRDPFRSQPAVGGNVL